MPDFLVASRFPDKYQADSILRYRNYRANRQNRQGFCGRLLHINITAAANANNEHHLPSLPSAEYRFPEHR